MAGCPPCSTQTFQLTPTFGPSKKRKLMTTGMPSKCYGELIVYTQFFLKGGNKLLTERILKAQISKSFTGEL